jgi:hypothetical protein
MVWRLRTGPTHTAGGGVRHPSGRTQLHTSLVAGLIGPAIAWLLPVSPGRWAGLASLLVAIAYGLWAY